MFRILLLCLAFAHPVLAAETPSHRVEMPDGRWFRIDLPDQAAGAPIILGLHGGGGNPDQFARNSGLSQAAVEAGYAVIYPAGTGRTRLLTWNGGYCCGYAARQGVDDVAFLDTVVARAAQQFGLDGDRVYVTGMSNGSIMAERYAALRPGAVRAVAGVAGTLDPAVRPLGGVPLLHIHGTADEMVPYAGGQGSGLTDTDFAPVESTMAAFAAAWPQPLTEVQGTSIDAAGGPLRQRDWRDAEGRPVVRLVTIEGGGHVWPGGRRADGAGPDATAMILRFFARYP
jgi:polyhydroxybutyrate depolymerase